MKLLSWEWAATMPSTNVRIGVTLILALGTGARVILVGWAPPTEWLVFLTGWAGLDVLQFGAKRATATEFVQAKRGNGVTAEMPVPRTKEAL
jgi:hypothetical protein